MKGFNNKRKTRQNQDLEVKELAQKAIYAHKEKKYKEAISLYRQALNIKSTRYRSKILINLGTTYKETKQYKEAVQTLEEAISINPSCTNAYINLSCLHLELKEYKLAEEIGKKGCKNSKTNISCITNLARALLAQKKYSETQELLYKALEKGYESTTVYLILCKIANMNDDQVQLFQISGAALEKFPEIHEFYAFRAGYHAKNQAWGDAIIDLNAALSLSPNSHIYSGELTRLKYCAGVIDEDLNNKIPKERDIIFENNNKNKLLIIFSSNGRPGRDNQAPSFNFYKLLKSCNNIDKLFIRDQDRNYYLKGLKYTTNNLEETIELIKSIIETRNYENVVSIGASSGGFASILYANLLGFSKAIAFNPQTVISEEKESVVRDYVFTTKQCKKLRSEDKNNILYQKCLNLKNFMPFKTKTIIHYSTESTCGVDKRHAEYIKGVNCNLIPHKSATHLLALEMKSKGELLKAIMNEFSDN